MDLAEFRSGPDVVRVALLESRRWIAGAEANSVRWLAPADRHLRGRLRIGCPTQGVFGPDLDRSLLRVSSATMSDRRWRALSGPSSGEPWSASHDGNLLYRQAGPSMLLAREVGEGMALAGSSSLPWCSTSR